MPTHMVLYVQDHLIAAITPPTGFSLTEMPNDRGGTDLRVMRGLDTVLKLRVRVNSFAITVQSSSPLLTVFVDDAAWREQGSGFIVQRNKLGRSLTCTSLKDKSSLQAEWTCGLSDGERLRSMLEDLKTLVKAATTPQASAAGSREG